MAGTGTPDLAIPTDKCFSMKLYRCEDIASPRGNGAGENGDLAARITAILQWQLDTIALAKSKGPYFNPPPGHHSDYEKSNGWETQAPAGT